MVDDCYIFIRVTMIKEITVMRISMRFLLQECRTLVTVFKNTDTLKVVPELKHTLAAGSGKYEYTWVAVAKENKTGNEFEYEIGKEKNLNYFIDLPLGKYAVYLNVLDQETEVTWRQHFDMEVIIQTTEG